MTGSAAWPSWPRRPPAGRWRSSFPRIGVAALAPQGGEAAGQLAALKRYVGDRLRDRPAEVPGPVVAEVPIAAGDEALGAVVLLAGGHETPPEAGEFLHLAAVASLTEVAAEEARREVEQNLRGSFLEELRARTELEPEEIVRRAARLGTDLSRGAIVQCAELTSDRPRHVVALRRRRRLGPLRGSRRRPGRSVNP